MKRLILNKLNTAQRSRIKRLCDICCEAEPLHLSLPLPKVGEELTDERFFVLYENGELISLLHLFYPDHQIGELIGFTHPDFRRKHCFTSLLSLAADYTEEIGLEQVYVISDGNSDGTAKALAALGLEEEYAEYMLGKSLHNSHTPLHPPTNQTLHAQEDTAFGQTSSESALFSVTETPVSPLTVSLFSEIFQIVSPQCETYLEEISGDSRIHTYVLSLTDTFIGQTQLTFMDDMAYISGFGILPGYRRQGYGMKFLNLLEKQLAGQSVRQLTLQVSSKNKNALQLYEKDGFEVLEGLHYYPLFEQD